MAAIRTAPAATSLALPATGWKVGDAPSVRNSKAVFRASAVHTETIARTTQHHSGVDSRQANPAAITTAVAAAWTQALCWDRSMVATPWSAYRTLRSRPVKDRLSPSG